MKTSILAILFSSTLLSSISFAKTVENVLIGPGIFPTQPSEFVKCLVEKSISGSQLQFLGLGAVNLLASDSSRIEIQFLAKDSSGKSGFFKIIANSTDQKNGWQKLAASNNNTFYFSSAVSSVAQVRAEGADAAVIFDFADCQN